MKLSKYRCKECGVTTFASSVIRECQHCGGRMLPIASPTDIPSALAANRVSDEAIKRDAAKLQNELEAWLGSQNDESTENA